MNTARVWGAGFLCMVSLGAASARGVEPSRRLHGVVSDEAGRGVRGAVLTLSTPFGHPRVFTGAGGVFSFEAAAPGMLQVQAPGFLPLKRRIEPGDFGTLVRLVLAPDGFSERVAVTATRTPVRLGDTAASIVVLTAEDLGLSASPALDDALRQVPAFSLFRRSGSRTANPTSQGVSLRGAGASGASRALVLDDGVPLNDAFGGWIYWGRVPRAAVDKVEILRAGASDLYGSSALNGVIQLLRRGPGAPFGVAGDVSYGSLDTAAGSFFTSGRLAGWGAILSGEAFQTDGYVLVEEGERGAVDTHAASRHATLDLTLERTTGSARFFLRGSRFEEERENGTPLQDNDTETVQVAAGAEGRLGSGALSARAYGVDQDFRQAFSAVVADRSSESLTRLQRVPSNAAGFSLRWTGVVHASHLLVAGLEGRQVRGESREEILIDTGSRFVDAGGRERTASLFLEDVVTLGARWTLTGGLRVDRWWNQDGHSTARASRDASPVTAHLPDRAETAWSPRISALYRLFDGLSLTTSASRSFRAPTLNELYRDFRVGNVLTVANDRLDPERSSGVEAGAIFSSSSGRLSVRTTLFWMEIEDAIGNLTVSSTPALITRQRQNIGRTRSRGVELDLDWRPAPSWRLSGGYQLADSTVRSSPAEPELIGLRVPQVPRHRLSLQPTFANPAIVTVAVALRWTSTQFEDDQNRLHLASFWTVDVFVSRNVLRGLQVFVAMENLFDERYEIGRTPVRTLGPPRTLRGGIRIQLPGPWPFGE